MSFSRLLSALPLLLAASAAVAAPSLEDRFSPRHYVSGGQRVVVDATLDHLALRADPARAPAELALIVEEAAAKVATSAGGWPLVSEVVLARPHGLFVVRFADDVPRVTLAQLARALAEHPTVDAVYPGLRRRSGRAFADERLVVTASAGRLDDVLEKVSERVGGRVLRRARVPNTAVVEVGAPFARDAVEASAALAGVDGLVSAEPELYREYALKAVEVDDPLFEEQWHLTRGPGDTVPGEGQIFAPAAWEVTFGDPSVVVAVFDSGTEIDHEDLAANVVGGFDAVDGDDDPSPECSWSQDGRDYAPSCPNQRPFRESHGTSVSGTIAAVGNNTTGVVGVCPGCSLLPVRLLGDAMGSGLTTAEAFVRAVDEGADVINNSWGPGASIYFPLSQAERDAFEHARTVGRGGLGTVIVFAAGNDTSNVALDAYAAWHQNVAVSASTNLDDFALYSNYGFEIDVAAPSHGGVFEADNYGIVTTDVTGVEGYAAGEYNDSFGGTSAASPVTAGVAGLVLSANPNLTAEQVRLVLTSTADKILADKIDWVAAIGQDLEELFAYDERGHSIGFGFGRVNAGAAVAAAASPSLLGAPCDVEGCALCDAASNRCLTTCSEQSDCPDGSVCDDGACRLPRPSYTAIGQPCSAACEACVPALDSQFESTEVCTAVCESDDTCPSGFDCRRPESGGPALCTPGSRSAGEPAGIFNCFNDVVGVSVIVETSQDRLCTDICLSDDSACPYGFACGGADCECTAGSNRGCWEYTCTTAAFGNGNFPVPVCLPQPGFGTTCDEDLDCPQGDYCKGGACVLDDRAGCNVCGACTTHEECGLGGYCTGLRDSDVGTCTKLCRTNDDCPGESACVDWDDGRGGERVCGSNVPAEPGDFCAAGWTCEVECRDDVPCEDGKVCDDGACVPDVHGGDAGSSDDGGDGVVTGSGCGCASSEGGSLLWLGVLLVGLVRRRQHSTPSAGPRR